MNLNKELIEKAKTARTPEELISMAKGEEIDINLEEAKLYFSKLNPKSGEVSDEELANISGGCNVVDGGGLIF